MFNASALALLLLTLSCGSAVAQSPLTHQHSFDNAEQWARVFDDPKRDEWQKPAEVVKALALAPDAAVADIGAGTGYFSVRLANLLPWGRIYAADAEQSMVRYLAERSAACSGFSTRVRALRSSTFAWARPTARRSTCGYLA